MALVVKSTKERVVKWLLATVLCIGLAGWCWYDAKYKYIGEEHESTRQFNERAIPVLLVLGIAALLHTIRVSRFRIEADEDSGISVNGREPIGWGQIDGVDTEILAKKGYLFLKYRKSGGEEAALKLDEYNLDFFDELYAMIRGKLGLADESGGEDESAEGSA